MSVVPARSLMLGLIIALSLGVFLLSGLLGLAILALATVIGTLTIRVGLSRVHMMGCLILPVILFLTGTDVVLLEILRLL